MDRLPRMLLAAHLLSEKNQFFIFFIFFKKFIKKEENEYFYMYSYSYSYAFVGQAPRMRICQSMGVSYIYILSIKVFGFVNTIYIYIHQNSLVYWLLVYGLCDETFTELYYHKKIIRLQGHLLWDIHAWWWPQLIEVTPFYHR